MIIEPSFAVQDIINKFKFAMIDIVCALKIVRPVERMEGAIELADEINRGLEVVWNG